MSNNEEKGGLQVHGTSLFATILRTYEKLLYLPTYFKNFQFFTFLRPDTLAGLSCFGGAAIVSLVLSFMMPLEGRIPKHTYVFYLSGLYTILSYLLVYSLNLTAPWVMAVIYAGVGITTAIYWKFKQYRNQDKASTGETEFYIKKAVKQLKSRMQFKYLIIFISITALVLPLSLFVSPFIASLVGYLVGLSIHLFRAHKLYYGSVEKIKKGLSIDTKPKNSFNQNTHYNQSHTSDNTDENFFSKIWAPIKNFFSIIMMPIINFFSKIWAPYKIYVSKMWESMALFGSIYYLLSNFLPVIGLSIMLPNPLTLVMLSAVVVFSMMFSESLLSAQDETDMYMDTPQNIDIPSQINPPSKKSDELSNNMNGLKDEKIIEENDEVKKVSDLRTEVVQSKADDAKSSFPEKLEIKPQAMPSLSEVGESKEDDNPTVAIASGSLVKDTNSSENHP
ncbi:hypothetical protein N9Y17_00720 [Gammaproteobacteria bacterium]|nr:hypothetical protein [Gammaproteobacteria bacterium]